MTTRFQANYGFERSDVTLATWRTAPYSRWSFSHADEIVPSALIPATVERPERPVDATDLLSRSLSDGLAGKPSIGAFLDYAHTDAFVLMKRGAVVAEHYAPQSDINQRHIVFSISKSLTALVIATLENDGLMDPQAPVTSLLPEAAGSAYGDCTIRDVLDMRVSLAFDEAYLNTDGAYARYRRATLWNPAVAGQPAETLLSFLLTLKKADHAHGGPHFYASPNSDLLGILIERATGERYADVMSERLWKPLGAYHHASITVDAEGSARAAGGISVTARDLARVGEMLRQDGMVDGKRIVPKVWIGDMLTAGDHQAWVDGHPNFFPNGRYRSQWYQSGEADGAFAAIGIHGQWLYVDPSTETVVVKLSSQPNPLDDELKHDNFAFFRALSALDL
ncbi:serine hydrolase domain-containing protein [Rhizobium glycinendophyticum]|uniref:Serine hydrolase n=1 Tax=Rhizobium glycinendophyticum TaxID=2589807 RepID=A0A504U7Y3_9HYPH|nr:serine hydrolase [Rhizobium glycinendophyticum]TPP06605.1 serine hydrolase [Rhizobium glycinendophyticum]